MDTPPVPVIPDMPDMSRQGDGLGHGKVRRVAPATYDRLAWKSEVGNVELFLRDIIGPPAVWVKNREHGLTELVHALAKHGTWVWCRRDNGEIVVIDEMMLDQPR